MTEYKLYRLRCSFDVDWDMPWEEVQKVARLAGDRFINDMEKRGYRLVDGRLHLDPMPRVHWEPVALPSMRVIEQMNGSVAGTLVKEPDANSGLVDYRMWGVFAHKEILTQREEDL